MISSTLSSRKLLRLLVGVAGICAIVTNVQAGELRVFLNERCIIADEPVVIPNADFAKGLPLGSLVVSDAGQAVITFVIRGIARALSTLAASREYTLSSEQDIYLYTADFDSSPDLILNPTLGCMTAVVGDFEVDGSDCFGLYDAHVVTQQEFEGPDFMQRRSQRAVENVLRRANVCLTREPDIIIENRMRLSEDGTALQLRGAGLAINKLFSTNKEKAERNMLLTATLFAPARDGRGNYLTSNWINYGETPVGLRIDPESDQFVSTWTPVPPISDASKKVYEKDSSLHREASHNGADIERQLLRYTRQLAVLRDRRRSSPESLAAAIDAEIERLDKKIVIQTGELQSWRAEYADLPAGQFFYMPVTLQLTLTEAKSEQRLLQVLAQLLRGHSKDIAEYIAVKADGGN